MRADAALEVRLKQQWSKSGTGPDVEAQLKAAQAALERREAQEQARLRGISDKTRKSEERDVVRANAGEAAQSVANESAATAREATTGSEGPDGRNDVQEQAPGAASNQQLPNDAQPTPMTNNLSSGSEALHLKEAGNKALASRQFASAVALYTSALTAVHKEAAGDQTELSAALLCNRAAAWLKLSTWGEAAEDARNAGKFRPDWPKPLYRLAQALCGAGDYVKAIAVCRTGERLLERLNDHSREFTPLMDQVTAAGALAGCLEVFDGREIRIRTAGEDAWLCLPAPQTAAEIEAERSGAEAALTWGDELGTLVLGLGSDSAGAAQVLSAEVAAAAARKEAALGTLSVRSVRDALDKARDGDRIIFENGPHNVGGDAVVVDKRVLIQSEGALGDAPVEQRGNAPVFRITRAAVLKDLDLDLCGFRECILVQGDARCTPVLLSCRIRSSGDHAFVAEGRCAPVLRKCDIRGRHAGVCTFDSAAPVFEHCKIDESDKQGVRAFDTSRPKLLRCTLEKNGHEGVVAMDRATVQLDGCSVSGNKGPGVDLSGEGCALVNDCTLKGNCGGVFLWDDARCVLQRTYVDGGSSHAILADEHSRPHIRQCRIKGEVHALSDKAAEGVAPSHNAMIAGDKKTQFPPESGCFKFEADRFTRKQ